MTVKRWAGACVVLLAASLTGLVACTASSSPAIHRSTSGPLQFTREVDEICAPRSLYPHVAMGIAINLASARSIVVQRIAPVAAHRLTINGYSVMPITGRLQLLLDKFPPVAQFPKEWPTHKPAIGETLTTSAPAEVVVDVVSTPGTKDSTLKGFTIDYKSAGIDYVATSHVELRITNSPCH